MILHFDAGMPDPLDLSRNDDVLASAVKTRNQIATAYGIERIGLDAAHPVYDAIVQSPDGR